MFEREEPDSLEPALFERFEILSCSNSENHRKEKERAVDVCVNVDAERFLDLFCERSYSETRRSTDFTQCKPYAGAPFGIHRPVPAHPVGAA